MNNEPPAILQSKHSLPTFFFLSSHYFSVVFLLYLRKTDFIFKRIFLFLLHGLIHTLIRTRERIIFWRLLTITFEIIDQAFPSTEFTLWRKMFFAFILLVWRGSQEFLHHKKQNERKFNSSSLNIKSEKHSLK